MSAHDVKESAEAPTAGPISPYRLGLDAGSNSLGWAVILLDETAPEPLVDCGVRIFPAGTADVKGTEKLKNEDRRLARQARRQLWRRVRRRHIIARLLAEAGLLAGSPGHADPYVLRRRALLGPVAAGDVGRALFHLVKRRGFKSNRKAAKPDDEAGLVATSISALHESMASAGSRTLGDYLAGLDTHLDRRRGKYLSRADVEDEFIAIWSAQAPHHPVLRDLAFFKRVFLAAFTQRPLRAQSSTIGACPLEAGEPRAPRWHWLAQEVRLLQEVNNLRVLSGRGERDLTADERAAILELLHTKESAKFGQLGKLIGLTEHDRFNLESLHRTALDGNKVEAGLRKHFKKRWKEVGALLLHTIWPVYNELDDEVFDSRAKTEWHFTDEDIKAFGKVRPGTGYAAYSLAAMEKLLPWLQQGLMLHGARAKAYPDAISPERDGLPLVPATDPEKIRNPVVLRTLSETRKVVNAIIREYGRPAEIIVELAREAKGTIEDRQKQMRTIRDNQRERDAIKAVFADRGYPEPSTLDILKYRLWTELGGPDSACCPYTGKPIDFHSLFGPHPRFDIEHILPYSRSFDDGFGNKTLCDVEENRAVKGNKAPAEAYDGDRLEEIITRVRHSRMRFHKARKFSLKGEALAEVLAKFSKRQLTDTSYAARLIRESLQQLFPSDQAHRVRVSNGVVTAKLRHYWGMNGMLPVPAEAEEDPKLQPGEKHRLDHRHHAVDAIVIALTNPGAISEIARRVDERKARTSPERPPFPLPWPRLRADAQARLDAINVSFAPSHKVSGQISKETNHGLIRHGEHAGKYVHRVGVSGITDAQVERIIDPVVRGIVREWLGGLREWQALSPKEKKATPQPPLPRMKAGPGAARQPVIKTVRIWESFGAPLGIPADNPTRFQQTGNNHHATFFRVWDGKKNRHRIVVRVCSLLEAYQRRGRGEPVIRRTDAEYPDAEFLFSLMINDTVMHREDCDTESLLRVQKLSAIGDEGCYLVLRNSRAASIRYDSEMVRLVSFPEPLSIRKVMVDPLGTIYPEKGSVRG